MEEDNEDYQALFFTECGELLGDLHEHLDLMMDGAGDADQHDPMQPHQPQRPGCGRRCQRRFSYIPDTMKRLNVH